MSTERRCEDCYGKGGRWVALTDPRRTPTSAYVLDACQYCDGQGSYTMPDVYDTAYPIDWAIAIGQATGKIVRGVVWSYDGPGIMGRPYAFSREGEALLASAPVALSFRGDR